MKKTLSLVIILIASMPIYGTEQVPDILYYQNKKFALSTGWGHPSPLQTYFFQNNIKYPFTMLSTANYRGHIATWDIFDNKLYLREVSVEENKYSPKEFSIKSYTDTLSKNDNVFADWFSGVIESQLIDKNGERNFNSQYYFHVRKGRIVNTQIITDKDYKRIQEITQKDTSNHELVAKYWMLILNQNYIGYYFRLYQNDTIICDGQGGYLSGNSNQSPILLYYSNDHTKWPYNWENYEKNGAPNCEWVIEDNKIFLTNIRLYSGTGFYSINKDSVALNTVFPNKVESQKVFGDWISGIYIIRFGKNIEDKDIPGYFEFKPDKYSYLRISDGLVTEIYTVPGDFNFKNLSQDIDPGLKKILDELK